MRFAESWSLSYDGCQPWYQCYSPAWEVKQYGFAYRFGRDSDGLPGEFPDVEWAEDIDCVMEQAWAIGLGYSEMPKPGFKKVVSYEAIA